MAASTSSASPASDSARAVHRISLGERTRLVTPVRGRRAAVAVPVVRHPRLGESLVITRRARINGHTGARMTNAGDIVLFGGSLEAGESAAAAALRELCEESGAMPLLRHEGLVVRDSLGAWVTEAGFHVDGFTVAVPGEFVSLADPDPREVAELAYFPTAQVRAAPVRPAYHLVDPRDHRHGPEAVMFESPTIELRHPDTGDPWVLWGLAGYMVAEWQAHELRS